MGRNVIAGLLALCLLAGCGGDDEIDTGTQTGGPGPMVAASGAVDLSTPEAAVRSFCGAADARDVPRMGACIAEAAGEKDLRRIALGEVSPADLDELRSLALGEVHDTEISADGNEAIVSVTFRSGRDEQFSLVRTAGGWKIDDF